MRRRAARLVPCFASVQARCYGRLGHSYPRLQSPQNLKTASTSEVESLLPFSYEICKYRHRSFEERQMVVKYTVHMRSSKLQSFKALNIAVYCRGQSQAGVHSVCLHRWEAEQQ